MVDFAKALGKKEIIKKTDPIEIYESLDRRSEIGPLRPSQISVLRQWYDERSKDRDLIIKLHTGEGKTVIGLLLLLSRINATKGRCLYICPNKHLVVQTINEALKFGIPYCELDANGGLPDDFMDGKKLLICHVQKLFNGKSVFYLDQRSIDVDTIILDDSHACIESINSAFTLKLNKDHGFYKKCLSLFEESLTNQGAGTYSEICNNEYNSFLYIPYWEWIDKQSQILDGLCKHKDEKEVCFVWPLLKNSLINYKAYISGSKIELSPIYIPMERFGTFNNANQRILMSATTQNDSFFIKGFNFSSESIKEPITNHNTKWSGEKMILLPSLIDDWLDRDAIISNLCKIEKRQYGVVAIVPSFTKANEYERVGARIANSESIEKILSRLKDKQFESTIVISNRYDGIDLPDDSCRLLIIDSKPFFDSLDDKYEESCRKNSDEIQIKIAQKVEQGLGRSVRGERDYSVVLIIGHDLEKFIKGSQTAKYFTAQTRQQIKIGLAVASMAGEEIKNSETNLGVIRSLINQVVLRDEGWKEYYKTEMEKIENIIPDYSLLDIMSKYHKATAEFYKKDYENSCEIMQSIVDSQLLDSTERAWYIQILAHFTYLMSKAQSSILQKSAFSLNQNLLLPIDGVIYKKVEFINENRVKRIKKWFAQFSSYEEMMLSANGTLSELSFGTDSEKFESALKEVGEILGFISQRPDKEFKKGPDNLWCGVDNQYLIFECKSEVEEKRSEVNKHEVGQMNTHCGWFEEVYNEAKVYRYLLIPTKRISYSASFTHNVKVIRKGKLKEFKTSILSYLKELKSYDIQQISSEKIQEFLDMHKLDLISITQNYSEEFIKSNS